MVFVCALGFTLTYKRAGNHIELNNLPHLWFLTKIQAEIIKAKSNLPPVADERLEDKLKLTSGEILNEMSNALKIIEVINKVENLEEQIEIETLTKLSVKERIIYILSSNGMKNKEIAKNLLISEKTVSSQKQRIKHKLGKYLQNPSN